MDKKFREKKSGNLNLPPADQEKRPSLISEFWFFLKHNKKWWLLPILIVLLLLSLLILLGGTAIAPFIYPLF